MLKMLKENFCPVDRPSSPTEIYKIHNNETQKTNDYVNKYIFFSPISSDNLNAKMLDKIS